MLAVSMEPAASDDSGSVVSPTFASTMSGNMSRASATTCVIIVRIPLPMSSVPDATITIPFACKRTNAAAHEFSRPSAGSVYQESAVSPSG